MYIQKLFLTGCATFLTLFSVHTAQAAVTLEVAQTSSFNVFGETTVVKPGNQTLKVAAPAYTNAKLPAGQYSLLINSPAGSAPETKLYINGDLQVGKTGGRISFVLEEGQTAFVTIDHIFNRVGKITVSSDPSNVPFTLTGPDGLTWEGVTPKEHNDLPEGQYSVLYGELVGCGKQRKLSDKLVKGGRITFTMDYICATADEMRQQKSSVSNENVTIVVEDVPIEFSDVGLNEWFAPYIAKVARGGMLNGYTNANGELNGKFGPNDYVDLAQLAKVAHKITGIDEKAARASVQNERAKGQWFEQYFASAEQNYWLAFITKFDNPGRNVTRAEVIGTFMQALDKERIWPSGNVYTDVSVFSKYADSIEIAARDGLLDTTQTTFRPNDPINRAELAKIISKVIEVYINPAN